MTREIVENPKAIDLGENPKAVDLSAGEGFRSIYTAHHQDHGSRYAFSLLDYPLLIYRSSSIGLICIANPMSTYNWY